MPTALRLFLGLISIAGLFLLIFIVGQLIKSPTSLLLVMTITYSTLTLLVLGFGLFSIKTFSLDNEQIEEHFLWGLFKVKTPIADIKNFKILNKLNGFGSFEEIIINKQNGGTIFIQEFDQKRFKEFKNKFSALSTIDNKLKPNYWTNFYKTSLVMVAIWIGLMIGIAIFC